MLLSRLPLSKQDNKWESQHKHKKYKNKHNNTKWRHYKQRQYYKKFLRKRRQRDNYNDGMDYGDLAMNILYPDLWYLDDRDEDMSHPGPWYLYMYRCGERIYEATSNKIIDRFREQQRKFKDFMIKILQTDYQRNLQFLVNKQLENFATNCDGMFLDYRNWAVYSLTTESEKLIQKSIGGYLPAADKYSFGKEYYELLSGEYFNEQMSKQIDDTSDGGDWGWSWLFTGQEQLFNLKSIHCNIIMDQVYAYGEQQMYKTMDALFKSVPDFPGDIFWEIIDYMTPFPQTGPTPVNTYYNEKWNVHEHDWMYQDSEFRISRTGLINDDLGLYWDFDNTDTIDIDFECLKMDNDDECKFSLKEVYHVSRNTVLTIVGKIEPQSLFIYLDAREHSEWDCCNSECSHLEGHAIIISKFWMELWNKIEMNCIKVDCYNNTSLSVTNSLKDNE